MLIPSISDNSYRPFLKTEQYPSYINVNPNITNAIIKHVFKVLNTRIRLSINQKNFHKSCKMYIEALKNSGFKEELTYLELKVPNNINNNKKLYINKGSTDCNNKANCYKNWKRKIIWFSHNFCKL